MQTIQLNDNQRKILLEEICFCRMDYENRCEQIEYKRGNATMKKYFAHQLNIAIGIETALEHYQSSYELKYYEVDLIFDWLVYEAMYYSIRKDSARAKELIELNKILKPS